VRLLLDTHIFMWSNSNPGRLPHGVSEALLSKANDLFVNGATAWKIAIKVSLGRLKFRLDDFDAMVAEPGFRALTINVAHGLAAGRLPRHHGDPFDRMLIAQARTEKLTLVTVVRTFKNYDVPLLA
jgi:PIN domain nuclease of toxin-antitoxin system